MQGGIKTHFQKENIIKGLTCIANDKGLSLLIRVFAVILPCTTSNVSISIISRRDASLFDTGLIVP